MADFDVIVIGGGHSGCEAAYASARLGARTCLLTADPAAIGAMSCNPAIGGVGKGHLVREVDAFGGLIARAAGRAAIHYRMLNASKGVAVHGPRVQADRRLFAHAVQTILRDQPHLQIVAGEAAALDLSGDVGTVTTSAGTRLTSAAVVIATGTFLRARMHVGEDNIAGGRVGEHDALSLAESLKQLGLPIARLKTGTPPRLDGRTIDWARLERQPSDRSRWSLVADTPEERLPQLSCWQTRTNAATHAIIRASLDRSPLRTGAISGAGPRYCPSIEDKVDRFGDRDGHLVFLEPEGLDDRLIYPNGISTSLPEDVQQAFVRTIVGLERAVIVQRGYAVEYDHVDPRALDRTLAFRRLPSLFMAGQINGTTGYEEAAAQGLVAGLNAVSRALGRPPILFERDASYIGVMIDDLVLQGVTEPYRMLTGRAEHRLRLRADNAEARLGAEAARVGALDEDRNRRRLTREAARASAAEQLAKPLSGAERREIGIAAPMSLGQAINEGRVALDAAMSSHDGLAALPLEIVREALADIMYAPYLERDTRERSRATGDRLIHIPVGFDYDRVRGLSSEMRERLSGSSPATLEEASRVRGVSPAALAALHIELRRCDARST